MRLSLSVPMHPALFWETLNKAGCEFFQLGFCDMEILHHSIHQRIYDDAHGTAECDVPHFIQQTETEFAYRLVILIFTLRHRKHHIAGKDNGDMGAHAIIRNPMVFLHELQIGFAGLEKDLYVPFFPINADDFFLGNGGVRTHQYQPFLPFALITDEYKLCRDAFPIFFDLHKYGQEIAGTSPALLVAAVDLLDVEPFTLVAVFCFAFFHHGYGVKVFLLFQVQYCFRR